ncbi:MAG: serine hydrolase [Candidatus Paceibacterota bacterium]
MKHSIYNRLIVVTCSLVIVMITIFILPSWDNVRESYYASIKKEAPPKIFPQVLVKASSAVVFDLEKEKIIFSKNPNEQLPLASVTKLMTVLVTVDNLDLADTVTISKSDLAGGSNAGLTAGDTWSVKNLINYTLVTSSNGGASALARQVALKTNQDFISLMNEKSEELRLDNTYFINPTGLDVGTEYGGSYGTARDTAILISYIVKNYPNLLEATTKQTVQAMSNSGKIYSGQNTNDIISNLPGLLASKTGFTYNAGGNLAIVFDAGLRQPIAIVVLDSTRETRFLDVQKLTEATIKFFSH